MRLRGKQQLETEVGLTLFASTYFNLLIDSFVCLVEPPDGVLDWIPEGTFPMLTLMHVVHPIARFRIELHKAVGSFAASGRDAVHILGLIEEGITLDKALRHWVDSLPEDWRPQIINNPVTSTNQFDWRSDKIHLYNEQSTALTWNEYRTVRIQLLESLLAALDQTSEAARAALALMKAKWKRTIATMVEEICASVAYCLGEVDGFGTPQPIPICGALCGYTLLWPLRVTVNSGAVTTPHRRWVLGKLKYIGEVLGIGQALLISRLMDDGAEATTTLPVQRILERSEHIGIDY